MGPVWGTPFLRGVVHGGFKRKESRNIRKGELVCRAKDFGSEVVTIEEVVLGIEDQFMG